MTVKFVPPLNKERSLKKNQKKFGSLKHGDIVCNGGYYYIWIRGIGGEMSYFGRYGELASKGSANCFYEKNRSQIVGNIFEGFNPWSKG